MPDLREFNFDLSAVASRAISSSTAFLTVTLMALLFVAPFASAEKAADCSTTSSFTGKKVPAEGDYWVEFSWTYDGKETPQKFQLEKKWPDGYERIFDIAEGTERTYEGAAGAAPNAGTYDFRIRAKCYEYWAKDEDGNTVGVGSVDGPWSSSVSLTLGGDPNP